MRSVLPLLLALVWIPASCKSKKPEEPAERATKQAKAAAPAPRPAISSADLQALLDAWLAAQNRGDFAAYEKLYARKLVGVKRVGARTYRFARDGWIADRQRMFKKKMTVEARDIEPFEISSRSATIRFVQRWASGKFEDIGPKRLMVVLEGDQLRIAQEEMLRSEIVDRDAPIGQGFYFLHGGGLVLHDATVPDEHGVPAETGDGEVITTEATVDEADLDEETRAWKGKKVRLDSGCEATVTGFRLVSRVVPHFGEVQQWNCQYQDDDCVEATPQERAVQAFAMGEPALVAALSGCRGVLFATPSEQRAPVAGEAITDAALEARALAAFARLERVVAQDSGDEKGWWKANESVSIFKHPESGQVIVSVHARVGEMCGGFSADHWQVWQLEDGELVALGSGSAPAEIIEAIDVNHDGRLELIIKGDDFGTEAALVDLKTMSSPVTYGYSYNDCPC